MHLKLCERDRERNENGKSLFFLLIQPLMPYLGFLFPSEPVRALFSLKLYNISHNVNETHTFDTYYSTDFHTEGKIGCKRVASLKRVDYFKIGY